MNERPEWFAPKRYGYGAGLPISWQGWLVLLGFLAVVIGSSILLAPLSIVAYLSLVLPLTLAFVWIASKTTRGGWRWRGGDDR